MSDGSPRRPSAAQAPTATVASPYPRTLRHSTEQAQRVYELMPGATAAAAEDDRDTGGSRGAPADASTGATAVYSDPDTGQRRVPSGRVFVRFAVGVSAAARDDSLRRAGYSILQVPAYAPHAAWLEAADGSLAQALGGIARLEALSDVENVEPQWLTERAAK